MISTAVALFTTGDRTTSELLDIVNRTLRTRTLTVPELDDALETARIANFVRKVTGMGGR